MVKSAGPPDSGLFNHQRLFIRNQRLLRHNGLTTFARGDVGIGKIKLVVEFGQVARSMTVDGAPGGVGIGSRFTGRPPTFIQLPPMAAGNPDLLKIIRRMLGAQQRFIGSICA